MKQARCNPIGTLARAGVMLAFLAGSAAAEEAAPAADQEEPAERLILSAPATHPDWMLREGVAWGPEGVRHMLDACKAAGWTRVYWRALDGGRSLYKSALMDPQGKWEDDCFYRPVSPEDKALTAAFTGNMSAEDREALMAKVESLEYASFDTLAEAVRYGHSIGIEVHAWLSINEDDHGWGIRSRFAIAHPEARWRKRDGTFYHSQLSFAFPEVMAYKLAIVDEILANYAVDGLFLDWIRTGDVRDDPQNDPEGVADRGYEEPLVAGFIEEYGEDPRTLPNGDERWVRFRARPHTEFMREVRNRVNVQKPGMPIAVMVMHPWGYRGHKNKIDGNLRGMLLDVSAWAREGLIDSAVAAGYYMNGGGPERAYQALEEETEGKVDVWFYGWVPTSTQGFLDDFALAKRLGARQILFWEADYIDGRGNKEELQKAMHEHAASPPGEHAPQLVLNTDCTNFFVAHGMDDMTLEGLQSFVDDFAGTEVAYLFINTSGQRTVFRSKVWDSYMDVDENELPEELREANRQINRRLVRLEEQGLDPIGAWVDRCREKGISPWVTMRMNDLHTVHILDHPMNSTFWREHPEYWRVPSSIDDDHFTADRCAERAFDFAHPAVRDYHMLLIRELLERYDVDGIELDWMRFWAHFAPGREKEGGAILTEYMGEIRELTGDWAKRRGHPVKIAARVPSDPQHARGLGLDGIAWAKRGLIDMLVPTPFWFTTNTDMPIELWRELLGPALDQVVLAPGIEVRLHNRYVAAHCTYNDLETSRGQVASLVDRGADHVYLFNYFFPSPAPEPVWTTASFMEFLNDGADLKAILGKPRRHVVTFDDAVPPGVPVACILPAALEGTRPAQFRIHTGPAPTSGRAVIRIGLSDKPGVEGARFKARVNGHVCEAVEAEGLPRGELCVWDEFDIKRELLFGVAPQHMNRGYNVVEVILSGPGAPQEIVWAEIRIEPGE
ncbi:MAG: family 10 glycosylhydrolase [Candidatus Hydrogenedentes bacterium]|nr:family 10 glycosylhydrolase [Candidatus Hydrogenedentota bacterium]